MPDNDVTKMKVADLKRELKLRGLVTTGNKNELQDRLQTALIDGELLEDNAISGDELLTDEDEEKILGADENELLQSPTTTPTVPELGTPAVKLSLGSSHGDDDILESPTTATVPTSAKKIVLKRKNSFISIASTEPAAAAAIATINTTTTTKTPITINSSTDPTAPKVAKMSDRNRITMGDSADGEDKAASAKVAQLSLQERLDMRAKKFGSVAKDANATKSANSSSASITAGVTDATDGQQLDLLKKRAERFGCVVSSKIAKIDAEEKLLKRKQRFGGAADATDGGASSPSTAGATSDVWAEKARQRLERFKSNPTTDNGSTTAGAAVAVVAAPITGT